MHCDQQVALHQTEMTNFKPQASVLFCVYAFYTHHIKYLVRCWVGTSEVTQPPPMTRYEYIHVSSDMPSFYSAIEGRCLHILMFEVNYHQYHHGSRLHSHLFSH